MLCLCYSRTVILPIPAAIAAAVYTVLWFNDFDAPTITTAQTCAFIFHRLYIVLCTQTPTNNTNAIETTTTN